MAYIIVGLGNPGEEYENTRHNTGRIIVEEFRKSHDFPEWKESPKLKALVSEGKIKKQAVTLLLPEAFMNKSGVSVAGLVKSKKAAEQLVVVHDDLDLPVGKMKLSYNRGAGGHRGVISIVKAVKTEGFSRIRVGISPFTSGGKIKKPHGERMVENLILGEFKPAELKTIKSLAKKAGETIERIILEGVQTAMSKQ